MSDALTTNDVRVLRLLVEHGKATAWDIGQQLRNGLGALAATRRLPKLAERGFVTVGDPSNLHGPRGYYAVTGDGIRALLATDRAAYGRFA